MHLDRRWALALCFATFGFYGLTTGAERPWGDGAVQARQGTRLWTAGRLDLPAEGARYAFRGADGQPYGPFSLGVTLSMGPAVLATALMAPQRNAPALWAAAHRVGNSLWGALAIAAFFALARTLGVPRRRALVGSAVLAVATQLWVYAHSDFSESYQTLALLLAVLAAVRAVRGRARHRFMWLGLAWGHLMLAKMVYFALIPLGLAYVARGLREHPRRRRALALAVAIATPFAVATLSYNALRTGHWLGTGRQLDHFAGPLSGSLWVGLYGLLLSSGKGLLFFDPALLLSGLGLRRFSRTARAEAWLIGGVVLTLLLIYARYVFWHGAWSYGPRFLTCLIPLIWLPVLWAPPMRGWARPAALSLVLASTGVQLLGCALYAGHHIHANNRLRRALWGKGPNDACGWCHQNHYLAHFVPQASPIATHAWLLKHRLRPSTDAEMRADAPWAYALPPAVVQAVEIERPYTDFFVRRRAATQPKGLAYLALALLSCLGGASWLRRLWRRDPQEEAP